MAEAKPGYVPRWRGDGDAVLQNGNVRHWAAFSGNLRRAVVVASTAPSASERLDGELVSVYFARRRRRTDESRREGAARHLRLAAVTDRAAAVVKGGFVEIRHGELQRHRSLRHVGERKIR